MTEDIISKILCAIHDVEERYGKPLTTLEVTDAEYLELRKSAIEHCVYACDVDKFSFMGVRIISKDNS